MENLVAKSIFLVVVLFAAVVISRIAKDLIKRK